MIRFLTTLSLGLLFSGSASADFFKCSFGHSDSLPVVMIGDLSKSASVLDYFVDKNNRRLDVLNKSTKSGVITYKLSEGHSIEIFTNQPDQNDGDVFFPYKAIVDGAVEGACVREAQIEGITVERTHSQNAQTGLSWVDFWPGEYGSAMGYKTLKPVVIPKAQAWLSVLDSKPAEKDCSLPKGKMIVPIKGESGEAFHSLYPTAKFIADYEDAFSSLKIGDEATLVSYLGEGYCLVEANGLMEFYSCPEGLFDNPDFPGIEGPGRAPYGNYVFAKCQEGHYSWISSDVFDADEDTFESVFLGF